MSQPAASERPEAAAAAGAGASALTWRALLTALVLSVGSAIIADYHDGVVVHFEAAQHNYVAPLALAFLFTFLLTANAGLYWLRRAWAWRAEELALVLALAMLATPLTRYVTAPLVSTIGYTRSQLRTQPVQLKPLARLNVYEALPARALLNDEESRRFDDGIVTVSRGPAPKPAPPPVAGTPQAAPVPAPTASAWPDWLARPGTVPWRVWLRPAAWWGPLVLCFVALSVSLGYLLYRQWAERELVQFPLAELSANLLQRRPDRALPEVFYNRRFWVGFLLLTIIFAVNGWHAHHPKMIEIPTRFQFYELADKFPFLKNSREGYSLLRGWMFFAVIAAAVLLPAELSFTSWVTWPLMIVFSYVYFLRTGQKFGGNENNMVQVGAFWAMAAVILHTGRRWYGALLWQAVGGPARGDPVDRECLWGCRVFLLAGVGLVAVLATHGVPLELAVIWVLVLVLMLLVISRLVAEMGVPWTPLDCAGPLTFLLFTCGEKALGARAVAWLSIVESVTIPSKSANLLLAPMAAQAAHVESRVSGQRAALRVAAPFLVIMLLAAGAVAVWFGYSSSGDANDYQFPARGGVNNAAVNLSNLYPEGTTPGGAAKLLAQSPPFGERWAQRRLDPRFLPYFAMGAALVLATAVARLKFPRFPLHPLPFVLFGSWLLSRYWFSFFLGWLIKKAILKIGGGRLFEETRPFFVGVVVGLCFIYSIWIVADIGIYVQNNFTFDQRWSGFFRDMFSN